MWQWEYILQRAVPFPNPAKLNDHFTKHGARLGVATEAEYLAAAENFMRKGLTGWMRQDVRFDGDTIRFDYLTREFAVVDASGFLRTYHIRDVADIQAYGGLGGWYEYQRTRIF